MLALGKVLSKNSINFHRYADDTQLYLSPKPDEGHRLNKVQERVKDIRHWMLANFLLVNF